MQTIGERLEDARKRKGISVREAAESTKIRGDYLQKFEGNSFDIDLPPLYLRGFLRTYARFLELDAERIVSEVDAALGREGKPPPRREHREDLGRVEFGGTQRSSTEDANGAPTGRAARDQAMMIKYGLIGGGALIGIVVLILLVSSLTGRSSSRNATPPPAATTANPPPATTVQPDKQTLVLTAVEATRVKIVQDLDNVTLFQGDIARGESKSFPKQGKLLITVEAGKKLRMEVNGRNYPVPIDGYGRFALD